MKTFLITVPTLGAGGMERAVINICAEIIKQGHKCYVYVMCGGDIAYTLPDGISVIYGNKNTRNKLGILYSYLKLRTLYSQINPYSVISFTIKYSTYVMLSLLGFDAKVFIMHRSNPYVTYGRLNEYLSKLLFHKATAFVVQTQYTRKVFMTRYNTERVIVFPNPVRELPEYNCEETEKIILSAGRLIKGKGFSDLIKIFKEIERDDWKLIILGDGPERENLSNLIKEYNLERNVCLIGFTNEIDIYLKKSSIFAFTSKSEGFPNALLEAMCTGLPCISYDCLTGPSDIISEGQNGFLVELNNLNEFKIKLLRLMDNPTLRTLFSQSAKQLKEKHSPSVVVSKFLSNMDMYINS